MVFSLFNKDDFVSSADEDEVEVLEDQYVQELWEQMIKGL